MPVPDTIPKYAYKIVPEPPPEPLPEFYPPSDLDRQDGFVHLSASWQIPITSSLFFADHAAIWVVRIRLSPGLAARTRWDEVPGSDGCAHLYGEPGFGAADVDGVRKFERGRGAATKTPEEEEEWVSWEEVFQSKEAVEFLV